MSGPGGVTYSRLVPASLLPPEDPSARPRRTVRDWWVDVLLFLVSIGVGLLILAATLDSAVDPVSDGMQFLDVVLGG
ncbi:MAG: hypothetical protein INR72_20655, partial [Williamsia herbipolensis]|nr:hypothetical protein [Williamsia herbipolensis]